MVSETVGNKGGKVGLDPGSASLMSVTAEVVAGSGVALPLAIPNASAVLVALGSTVKIGRRPLPVLEGELTPATVPVFSNAKSDVAT